jgi:hypothetical protein
VIESRGLAVLNKLEGRVVVFGYTMYPPFFMSSSTPATATFAAMTMALTRSDTLNMPVKIAKRVRQPI